MKVYVVVSTSNYVPYVDMVTKSKAKVLEHAKDVAAQGDWKNAVEEDSGEIYFNQEEKGHTEEMIQVEEVDLDET